MSNFQIFGCCYSLQNTLDTAQILQILSYEVNQLHYQGFSLLPNRSVVVKTVGAHINAIRFIFFEADVRTFDTKITALRKRN